MAKTDIGKNFEEVFKQDWKKCFPNTFILRLKDQMNGYKETSQNPCDFICLPEADMLFLMECKEHKGASIPFDAIPQYERLLRYKNYKYTYPGILIWFSEKDIVIWVDIKEAEKMVINGEKSIGLRMLKEDYPYKIIVIPSIKKRVYMESNYLQLIQTLKGDKV